MEQHLLADIPVKALICRDGNVLIVRDQKWELPGGRMNVGEQPEEALHREIDEELRVKINILGMHDAFVRTSERTGQTHLIVIYQCKLINDSPFYLDGKEIQETRWISTDDDLSKIDFFEGYPETLKKFFERNEDGERRKK